MSPGRMTSAPPNHSSDTSGHLTPELRLAITLLVPIVTYLAGYITIPGLDLSRMPNSPVTSDPIPGLFNLPPRQLGILSLGLNPLLSAFIVVEFAALIVPGWRRRRTGGAEGRRPLMRATAILCALFALVQAAVMALNLAKMGMHTTSDSMFVVIATASLVAGTALMIAAAMIIDANGLTVGLSAIIAGELLLTALASAYMAIRFSVATTELPALGIYPLALAVVAYVLISNRKAMSNPADGVFLPLPTSGIPPATIASSVLLLVAILFPSAAFLHPLSIAYTGAYLALITLLVAALSLAFNHPRRVAEVYRRLSGHTEVTPDSVRSVLTRTTLRSLALIGGLAMLGQYNQSAAFAVLGASPLVLTIAVAAGVDIYDEWNARTQHPLVEVWRLHRVYVVPPVLKTLSDAGIEAHVRGLHHRSPAALLWPTRPDGGHGSALVGGLCPCDSQAPKLSRITPSPPGFFRR